MTATTRQGETPRIDREEYTVSKNDIGFKVVNSAVGRILERELAVLTLIRSNLLKSHKYVEDLIAAALAVKVEAERERDGLRNSYNNEARLIANIWYALGLSALDEVAHIDDTLDGVVAKIKQRAEAAELALTTARAEERERCAKACDKIAHELSFTPDRFGTTQDVAMECSAVIFALSDAPGAASEATERLDMPAR